MITWIGVIVGLGLFFGGAVIWPHHPWITVLGAFILLAAALRYMVAGQHVLSENERNLMRTITRMDTRIMAMQDAMTITTARAERAERERDAAKRELATLYGQIRQQGATGASMDPRAQ